jgi:hypothetical protein
VCVYSRDTHTTTSNSNSNSTCMILIIIFSNSDIHPHGPYESTYMLTLNLILILMLILMMVEDVDVDADVDYLTSCTYHLTLILTPTSVLATVLSLECRPAHSRHIRRRQSRHQCSGKYLHSSGDTIHPLLSTPYSPLLSLLPHLSFFLSFLSLVSILLFAPLLSHFLSSPFISFRLLSSPFISFHLLSSPSLSC